MTISWIQAILQFFASLSSMPGMGGSVSDYTLSRPLIGGWSGLITWRCDNRYYVRGCPSSHLYRLGNTWIGICNSCHSISVFLLLSCLCMQIASPDEAGNCSSCSPNRCGRWDQSAHYSFLRNLYHELLATQLEAVERSTNSTQLTGFYPWISLPLLFSFQL